MAYSPVRRRHRDVPVCVTWTVALCHGAAVPPPRGMPTGIRRPATVACARPRELTRRGSAAGAGPAPVRAGPAQSRSAEYRRRTRRHTTGRRPVMTMPAVRSGSAETGEHRVAWPWGVQRRATSPPVVVGPYPQSVAVAGSSRLSGGPFVPVCRPPSTPSSALRPGPGVPRSATGAGGYRRTGRAAARTTVATRMAWRPLVRAMPLSAPSTEAAARRSPAAGPRADQERGGSATHASARSVPRRSGLRRQRHTPGAASHVSCTPFHVRLPWATAVAKGRSVVSVRPFPCTSTSL